MLQGSGGARCPGGGGGEEEGTEWQGLEGWEKCIN